ncbi:MAG: PAS domain S-box protein [Actinomycetota bacterium]|nr:PAS domain S-box protein [Actinomycetota bacterium]
MRPQEFGIGTLFERVRDAVIVAEAHSGRVLLWNPAAEKVFGYSSSEALGMRVEALVPEYLKGQHRTGMTRYAESGRGPHIDSETLLDLPAVRKDGREIRVELSLNPLDSGNGANGSEDEERYVLAVVRDVSRRKEAEEALNESEERMRGLADAAFEGILITERGEILEANRAFFEMLGYEPRDVIGHSALEFVAPEYRELVQKNMLSGYEEPYEIAGINAAGERVDLEVRGRAFSYRGRTVRVTALQDIGERKQAQEAQARLAAIVESSDDAIIGKTLEGVITSWNSGARKIYGYTPEEAVGRSISILVPEDRPDEITGILERIRRGESIENRETVRARKDGSRLHVSITVSPIRNSSGEIVGASTIARDITERKKADEEIKRLNETLEKRVAERTERLAESERRLKELVGKLVAAQEEERRSVAYEIHDGLTQIAIAAHQTLQVFAQKHPPGTPVQERSLDRALVLAQRVVREARHVIEELRPTSLDDFGLAAALRLEIEELREEGWEISLEEDLREERLEPETETALYRVAMEALTNVRKHASTTRAAVRLSRRPRVVRLEVKDEGRGFNTAAPFRRGRGEKVGLAGMRERVALLGGRLQINSHPGKGTTVIAEIPLEEGDTDVKAPRHPARER